MKINARTKRILLLVFLFSAAVFFSGCVAPRDDSGQTIYIWNEVVDGAGTFRTSFSEVLNNENWFQAIIVYPLTWLINQLAGPLSIGGAIAIVTLSVNGILGALTIKSSIATQQMQLIQPQLEKIQRKYEGKNDQNSKMRQAQEQQALFNKYNINPMSSILVTFLQFPIIIAMYQAVHRSYAVQSGTFLGMILKHTPLEGIKELFAGNIGSVNYLLLFIFMGVCQFISMSLPRMIQKKKAEEEAAKHHRKPEEPSKQNQFMQYYMLIMILSFGLMWPSAMSLYWAINSLVQIIKTLMVQKVIDKQQKAGA